MTENIQKYTPSDLKFSSSKLYFQYQTNLLMKIWFISSMTTDIHFKYTFQKIEEDYFVEWGEFEWLTLDHDVHEQWIIYKVGFLNPKFQNIENLSLDLNKKANRKIWPWVASFFWWCLVFALLFWLASKSQFWQVLFWLNIIWASIFVLFYAWKFINIFYDKTFKVKNIDYWGINVNYSSQSDALVLSQDVLKLLKSLKEKFWIIKFCYTGNCIYLLQDIHDRDWNRLSSSSQLYSEQEKANLQQRTLEFIGTEDFLSNFMMK